MTDHRVQEPGVVAFAVIGFAARQSFLESPGGCALTVQGLRKHGGKQVIHIIRENPERVPTDSITVGWDIAQSGDAPKTFTGSRSFSGMLQRKDLNVQAVTLKDAKKNLPQLVDRVLADAEAHIVITPSGQQVVLMPLDEYESWKETLYLLSNPVNAEHLRRSIKEAEEGQVVRHELSEA